MSDSIRISTDVLAPRLRQRINPRRPSKRYARRILGVVVLLLGIYELWTTRNRYPICRFIPADSKFSIVLTSMLVNREELAVSKLWQAVPDSARGVPTLAALTREIDLPDWVLNNLVGRTSYVCGSSLRYLDSAVFFTEMSRLGTLIERLHRLTPWIERDYAGGLELRKLTHADLYYAVRGRVLAVSPSRAAVIRCITLRDRDALGESAWDALTRQSHETDVYGRVALAIDDPGGDVIESADFALRLDPTRATLKAHGLVRRGAAHTWHVLLDKAAPQPLVMPPEGLAVLSVNLGKPVKELWKSLYAVLHYPVLSPEQWEAWEKTPGLPQTLTGFMGGLGPGVRVSWQGLDLNEILPVPEVVATFDLGGASVESLFSLLQPPPVNLVPSNPFPRLDPATQRVHMPLMSGPSMELTAGAYGHALLVSTSRTVAERLLAEPAKAATLAEPGNLYVRLQPAGCLKAVADAARLFAEVDVLKGYTAASFERASASWLEKVRNIASISVWASSEKGAIALEVTVQAAE